MIKIPNVITMQVLLHYYCTPVAWSAFNEASISSCEAHRWLVRHGMITVDAPNNELPHATVTPKGNFYVVALKDVPLPEIREVFHIPGE